MDAPIPVPPIPMVNNNQIPQAGGFILPRMNGQMIAPRPRGAAGIRGLGAPGTPPPRSLIRKLANPSSNMPTNGQLANLHEYYEMYLRSLAEFTGLFNFCKTFVYLLFTYLIQVFDKIREIYCKI